MKNASLRSVDVSLKFPQLLELKGTWTADDAQQRAAWEIYVELVTRVTVVPLRSEDGNIREALTSLHALFAITRSVLRSGGPSLARPEKSGQLSLGMIAVDVLNHGLRPFLTKWHPLLTDWEAQRTTATSITEHELSWRDAETCRLELEAIQKTLLAYADLLGAAAGVPSLVLAP